MKALTIIIMLLLTSCTVNHYTCDCKHQAQFMPGQYTVPGIYYTPARPGHTILPSNIDLLKNDSTMIMTVDPCKHIGIGGTVPSQKLDIKGTRLNIDTLHVIK